MISTVSRVSKVAGITDDREDFKGYVKDIYNFFEDTADAEDLFKAANERYVAGYKKSAELVRERAKTIAVPDLTPETERLLFTSGGYGGEKGLASNRIAAIGEQLFPTSAAIPILNKNTDVKEGIFTAGLRWLPQAIAVSMRQVFRGYNPDAIEMATKAYAFHQKHPGKPIDMLGYSGGALPVSEAGHILQELQVPFKAISWGGPHVGRNVTLSPDLFLPLMGELDPLRVSELIPSGVQHIRTTGGATHLLPNYAQDPDVYRQMTQFLYGQRQEIDPSAIERIGAIIPTTPQDFISPKFLTPEKTIKIEQNQLETKIKNVQPQIKEVEQNQLETKIKNVQPQIKETELIQYKLSQEIKKEQERLEQGIEQIHQRNQEILLVTNKRAKKSFETQQRRKQYLEQAIKQQQQSVGDVQIPVTVGLLSENAISSKEAFQSRIKANKSELSKAFQKAKETTGQERINRLKTLLNLIEQESLKVENELTKQPGKEIASVLGNYKSHLIGKGKKRPGLESQIQEKIKKTQLSMARAQSKPLEEIIEETAQNFNLKKFKNKNVKQFYGLGAIPVLGSLFMGGGANAATGGAVPTLAGGGLAGVLAALSSPLGIAALGVGGLAATKPIAKGITSVSGFLENKGLLPKELTATLNKDVLEIGKSIGNQLSKSFETAKSAANQFGVSASNNLKKVGTSVLDTFKNVGQKIFQFKLGTRNGFEFSNIYKQLGDPFAQAGVQATKNELEVRQQMEAKATDEINRRVQEREAILKREQNAAGENIKREVLAGKASIEQAIEQTANLPVEYAEKSIESANQQLSELESAYKRGEISYRTYEERKRDILNQLSDLRKQKAEAVEQAITKLISWHAAKRESILKRQQNEAPELIKQQVISGETGLDKGVEQAIKLPGQFTDKQVDDTKAQFKEIEEAWKKGQLSVETYDAKRRELTDRLSDLRKQKIEQIEQAITEIIALHAAKREAILRREQNTAPEIIKWQAISGKIGLRQASEQLDKMPATFTGKQIENTLAQLKEVEAAFRRGEMNVKAYEEKRRELTTALSDQRRQQIEQIEQATTSSIASHVADREALIKREEFAAIASVRRRYLARTVTEKQAAEDIAKISLDSTNKQVATTEAQLKEYQSAFRKGQLNPKAYMEKERELVTSLHDLKKQLLEQEIALRDAGNAKILEGIELANRLAEAQIQKFSDNQTLLIKRSQLEDRPEYVASRQLEQLQGETLNKQIEDTKRRMSETDNLYRRGVITDPKQYTEQRLQLEQQLAQQQIQLLDNQIAQQKRLREEQAKAIDDRIRGIERSQELANAQLDLQAKGIELQVKEVELIQKADDLSKQLLESRHNLAKALSDAELGQTQIRLDAMSRGKDLMSKVLTDDRFSLNTSDVDLANLKAVLNSQLGELGIGVDFDNIRQLKRSADMGSVAAQRQLNQYEIAVLDARSRLEDELAAKKLNALGLEQQFQRENLDLELRRGELQARSALFAAKQAEFQVQQSKLQLETQAKLAKLEEEKAKLIEDPRDRVRAIADARAKLELATGQLDLVPDQLLNAQELSAIASENVSAQKELALNARATMDATQANERSQFVAAQNARKQAEQLERAEAAAKRTAAANAAGSGGLSFANLSYEHKQQLDVAMQTLDSYSGPMDENQRRSGLVNAAMSGNPFLTTLLRQQGEGDIVDIANKMKANSNPFDLSASQARMSAQLNNRDVVGELQRLNENVSRLASEPRSISVSTATPMEDTMRIMSDINRPRR